jgi:DNA anti-recombination protein RmuC
MSARGKKKETVPTPDNVDQIREIIFGGVMRDYDSRFKELTDDFEASTKSLRSDYEARLEALTKQFQRESEKAAERLKDEAAKREKGLRGLANDLSESDEEHRSAAAQLQTRLDDEADSIRHDAEQLRKQLLDRIGEEADSLKQRIQSLTTGLDERKVGRDELAGLLQEVALRLKGELKLPESD